jgi:phenylpropionate dioxygenase-like ring-hydroxylating dioxygenase large terminal subunit
MSTNQRRSISARAYFGVTTASLRNGCAHAAMRLRYPCAVTDHPPAMTDATAPARIDHTPDEAGSTFDLASRSLPAWVYWNAEFFALEQATIFARNWQLVCHVADIAQPGDYRVLQIARESIVVIRGSDGTVRAFHNVCRHRAARLLDGEAGRCPGRIVCPYHAWAYAPDGRLVWVPFEDQYDALDKSTHGLVAVECEIRLGFVWIRLESGGPSIDETLAPLAPELALYRPQDMQPIERPASRDIEVNWKTGTDNYVDALHVRVAHPGLNALLNRSYGFEPIADGVQRLYGRVEEITGDSVEARRYHAVLPDVAHLPATHKRLWLYFMLWPNVAFNLYPDLIETMHFVPVTATRTWIRFGTYALPDARPAMQEARALNVRLNVDVGREDTDLITRVQAGMQSRAWRQGPLGRNETCLRAFAARLRRELPVCLEPEPPSPGTVAARNRERSPR